MNSLLPSWPSSLPPLDFIWPQMLWLELLAPLVVLFYFYLLSRKKKSAMRFGHLATVKVALGRGGAWRRHVPPALFLVSLIFTIAAVARPTAMIMTPSNKATVLLTMDVSGSMRALDMKPSRIVAAQEAAKAFVNDQPKDIQIGIVAFAATAMLVQAPTTDHAALLTAIDRFDLQRGTAVGSGILASLATLFPNEDFAVNGANEFTVGGGYAPATNGVPLGAEKNPVTVQKKPDPVEPGSLKTAIVILMTDGATTTGPDPVEAARQAADHGLRVYTIGFGARAGSGSTGFNGGGFGGGYGGGYGWGGRRMNLDETALKRIADVTRSKYYYAGSSEDLKKVYQTLSKQRIVELKETEITSYFAAIAALFSLAAATLSLLWFNRLYG
jgi:Ca-activated chloride channel family protein